MVWPAAWPLLTITLSPSAPVAARMARHSRGKSEPVAAATASGTSLNWAVRLGTQRVAAVDRIDVEEGDGLGRLEKNSGRRDLAVDDLAEQAVRFVPFQCTGLHPIKNLAKFPAPQHAKLLLRAH